MKAVELAVESRRRAVPDERLSLWTYLGCRALIRFPSQYSKRRLVS
jgi:hypothetical protein